ncbi:ATP-binding cassette domain-containing protein [Allokutzneria oryzae]|uniref:ATP-binding cassette domain-containing protein n=1 Tax=Allokutzneria oryzae TaxID=1378989 RepID=A0ABV5ZU77_9PSEU
MSSLLLRHLRSQRPVLLRVAALSTVEAAPALASGLVIAAALDQGFLVGSPMVGTAWLALLAALHVVRGLAERAVFPLLSEVVESFRDSLVSRVVGGTIHRAADSRSSHSSTVDSAAVGRLTGQVEQARGLTGALLRTVRPMVLTLVAAVAGFVALAPSLVLIMGVPLLVVLVAFPFTVRALARRRREVVLADEEVAARSGQVLLGLRDITALGVQDRAAEPVIDAAERHAAASAAQGRVEAVRALLTMAGGYVPLLLLIGFGPWLLGSRVLSPGEFVGAATYVTAHLLPALRMLTGTVSGLWTQLAVTLTRIAETTAAPPPTVRDSALPEGCDVIAEGLTFSYGAAAEPVVRELDLAIAAGDHLAIVGASGSGKSTLAALLAGVEEPDTGRVLLGGVPITSVDRGEVALIPQQAFVFVGTLGENLRYLAREATDAELDHAADALGMRPIVDRLGGYSAVVDAAALSGGERQLIALARVYLSRATVVILDEATSELDPAAEDRVERAFAARRGTLIVVAHRLASADRARRVFTLCALGAQETVPRSR